MNGKSRLVLLQTGFFAQADNLSAWIMPTAINDFILYYSLSERNSCGLIIKAPNE